MKTLIYIIILLIIFAFLMETEITFKPFKIKANWYYGIGILLISIGIGFISYSAKKQGQKQVLDVLTEMANEKEI